MIALRAMMMRGGTSKGVYLLKSDLDDTGIDPDVLLPAIMGSGDQRQIDGMGSGSSTTSKVAIVGPSTHPDCDIDYLFAQVDVATMRVDWTPTCGNILTGVGPFAIERGLVAASKGPEGPEGPEGQTLIRVHLVNTGATVVVSVLTPGGRVRYDGDWEVSGVPGTAAPIDVVFSGFCGGRTGTLFPTGNPIDDIGGIEVTAIDAGVCAIIVDAHAFGIAGDEPPHVLNNDARLLADIESVRLRAGLAMGLGDVSGSVLPKVMLVTKSHLGDLQSRYFVPATCHPTHAVSGAICLATAATVPGTVVARLLGHPYAGGPLAIEHPAGTIGIEVAGNGPGLTAAVRSTARKLFDGFVFAELAGQAA
ncbi:PrpF domain-containing protein [Mycobacterium sp.]|uniref:PrpF domain-containing protein n=1 Tax=Mycobacterium sp. TaxID=1785 RepID=UPI003C73DE4C